MAISIRSFFGSRWLGLFAFEYFAAHMVGIGEFL
jgi:hypothetical protein